MYGFESRPGHRSSSTLHDRSAIDSGSTRTDRARTVAFLHGSGVGDAPRRRLVHPPRRGRRPGDGQVSAGVSSGVSHEARGPDGVERSPAGAPARPSAGRVGVRPSGGRVHGGVACPARVSVRESTWAAYRNSVGHLVDGLGGGSLRLLSALEVERFEHQLLTSGRSAKTVTNAQAVLYRALADAVRDGLVDRDVASLVSPPRAERPEVTTWTVTELRQFLRSVEGHRLYAAFVVLATPGCVAVSCSACNASTTTSVLTDHRRPCPVETRRLLVAWAKALRTACWSAAGRRSDLRTLMTAICIASMQRNV